MDIIANTNLNIASEESKYLPILKKIEGNYPVRKCSFGGYNILTEKEPKEGLVLIDTVVENPLPDVNFSYDVIKTTKFLSDGYEEELKAIISGSAFSVRNYPDLGISKRDIFYFYAKEKLDQKDIERLNFGKLIAD